MHDLLQRLTVIEGRLNLIFHSLDHIAIHQEKILTAIGEIFAAEDARALKSLSRRTERIAGKIAALDALTPNK